MGLPTDVLEWIEATVGATVVVDRIPGGNRRQAWTVDVGGEPPSWPPLFLYFTPERRGSDDVYTIEHEAAVYRSLSGRFPSVPRLVGVHPNGSAMLTERVHGTTAFHALGESERGAVADDLIDKLAALHRLDGTAGDFPGSDVGGTTTAHIRAEIARWEQLYRATARLDPLIELALAWLSAKVPEVDRAPAIVHGDAGPGNFLIDGDRVTALIDWELSHLGDPMEDLAWLSMRSVFESVPDFSARLSSYARAMGEPLDLDRLRYHRVLVEMKVAIIRHRAADDPAPNGDVANGLISRVTNRRLLLEALTEAAGWDLPAGHAPTVGSSERDWLYEALLNMVRDVVVPRSTDTLVITRAKSMARIVKYLREADRSTAAFEESERAALAEVLDRPVEDLGTARDALALTIRSGTLDSRACLGYLADQMHRETTLMRPALGAIADRHLPMLPG